MRSSSKDRRPTHLALSCPRWTSLALLSIGLTLSTGCLRLGFDILGAGQDDRGAAEDAGVGAGGPPVNRGDGAVSDGAASDGGILDGSASDGALSDGASMDGGPEDGGFDDRGEICPITPRPQADLASTFAWVGTPVGAGNGVDLDIVELSVADLNADGHLDVVALIAGPLDVTTNEVDNIVVLRGDGTGAFSREVVFRAPEPEVHQNIVVSDFNVDGWLDIVSSSGGHASVGHPVSGQIRALANNGLGGFSSLGAMELPFAAPTAHVAGLAVAELTQDPGPDIAIGVGDPWGAQFVRVYAGDSQISPGLPYFDLGGVGWEIGADLLALDLNGDSLADLAMANRSDIAYFERASPTGFSVVQTLAPSRAPGGVDALAAGDLNGDGRPDLVSTDPSEEVWAVLSEAGGGFSAPTTLPLSGTGRPLLGDFDGDARADVASIVPTTDGIELALSGGGGADLRSGPRMRTMFGTHSIASGDFDEDGVLDLVFASRGNESVTLLRGTGSGCFPTRAGFQYANNQDGSRILLADVDNDGLLDISSEMRTIASLHLGTAHDDPRISRVALPGSASNYTASDAKAADFDGDGLTDVALALVFREEVAVYRGTGGPFPGNVQGPAPFQGPAVYSLGAGVRLTALEASDLTGDGRPELIVAYDPGPAAGPAAMVGVFLNDGTGALAPPSHAHAIAGPAPKIVVSDVTGDDIPDLLTTTGLTAGPPPGAVLIQVGLGNGAWTTGPSVPAWITHSYDLDTLDFDGDGHLDLVVTDPNPRGHLVLLRGEPASFGLFREVAHREVGASYGVAVADFTGDGRPDIAVASYDRDAVLLFEVSASGALLGPEVSIGLPSPRAIAAGDVDADGDIDLVITGDDLAMTVVYNQRL